MHAVDEVLVGKDRGPVQADRLRALRRIDDDRSTHASTTERPDCVALVPDPGLGIATGNGCGEDTTIRVGAREIPDVRLLGKPAREGLEPLGLVLAREGYVREEDLQTVRLGEALQLLECESVGVIAGCARHVNTHEVRPHLLDAFEVARGSCYVGSSKSRFRIGRYKAAATPGNPADLELVPLGVDNLGALHVRWLSVGSRCAAHAGEQSECRGGRCSAKCGACHVAIASRLATPLLPGGIVR